MSKTKVALLGAGFIAATGSVFKQMVAAGTLTAASLVSRTGMAGWQTAVTVPELAGLFGAASSTPPPVPPSA